MTGLIKNTRILTICLLCLLCISPWCTSNAQDTSAITPPATAGEANSPGLVGTVVVIEPNATEPNEKRVPNLEPNEPNAANESSGDIFNKEFDAILSEYVNEQGMVDYARLRRHRLQIKAVLAQLAILDPDEYESWTRNEKIAFWINTYNILMLDIIVENYPIESKRLYRLWWSPKSIRHIPPRSEVGTPKWNGYKFIVMDEEFTLYEIEDRFFKTEFADPRIFLTLSFASLDSPPLKNTPYYGKNLDKQLDEQVARFLSKTSAVRIDKNKDIVYLSVLFEPKWPWYGTYFLADYATDKKFKSHPKQMRAILNFLCGYLDNRNVSYLETGNYSVKYKGYDWRVNEQ